MGIRTPDLLNAIETRSQLRHSPVQRQLYTSATLKCNNLNGNKVTSKMKIGGSVWESNPPSTGVTRAPHDFEDREGHQAPCAPMLTCNCSYTTSMRGSPETTSPMMARQVTPRFSNSMSNASFLSGETTMANPPEVCGSYKIALRPWRI